jgi:hypothetical protein
MNHSFLRFKFKKKAKKYYGKNCLRKIRNIFDRHSDAEIIKKNELELVGLLDMIDGLKYHFKKFVKMEKIQRKWLKKRFDEQIFFSNGPKKDMIHEIVAYLNRLGQIETLFTSKWFVKLIKKKDLAIICPTILALLPLRNKFASHRSIDDPGKETDSQIESQSTLPFGVNWRGRASGIINSFDYDSLFISYDIKISLLHRSSILRSHKIPLVSDIEIFTGEEIFIMFIPTKHHQKICNEIVNAIQKVFEI